MITFRQQPVTPRPEDHRVEERRSEAGRLDTKERRQGRTAQSQAAAPIRRHPPARDRRGHRAPRLLLRDEEAGVLVRRAGRILTALLGAAAGAAAAQQRTPSAGFDISRAWIPDSTIFEPFLLHETTPLREALGPHLVGDDTPPPLPYP